MSATEPSHSFQKHMAKQVMRWQQHVGKRLSRRGALVSCCLLRES